MNRLLKNTLSSLCYQVVVVISGFVIPRAMLAIYGSEVNGLVNSINQFLGMLAFFDMGFTTLIMSKLYSPLAQKDYAKVKAIRKNAIENYNRIIVVGCAYIVAFSIVSGLVFHDVSNTPYIIVLVMGAGYLSQTYIGTADKIILMSDQRGYVFYFISCIAVVIYTAISYVLILLGFRIEIVKIVPIIVYLLRAVLIKLVTNKIYDFNAIGGEGGACRFENKYSAFMAHAAALVLDSTDSIILTFFSDLYNVSVYSVYNMIAFGLRGIFVSLTNGLQPLFGELWAKKEYDVLKKVYVRSQCLIHLGATTMYSCALMLIVPFVEVYTQGVHDTNYLQPMFAVLIVFCQYIFSIRIIEFNIILAAGHYKETKNSFIIAMFMNIALSVVFVEKYGLIGVTVGTAISLIYQTIYMIIYTKQNLLEISYFDFIKQVLVDCACFVVDYYLCVRVEIKELSLAGWTCMAILIVIICAISNILIQCLVNLKTYKAFWDERKFVKRF